MMNTASFFVLRSADRLSWTNIVWRRLCVTASTVAIILYLGLFTVPSAAHADPTPQGPATGRSVTHGHVFLYTSQGTADVSRMLYSVDGQTYVADDTESIPIYIDYQGGGVFDSSGAVMGYVDLS